MTLFSCRCGALWSESPTTFAYAKRLGVRALSVPQQYTATALPAVICTINLITSNACSQTYVLQAVAERYSFIYIIPDQTDHYVTDLIRDLQVLDY